MKRIIWVVLCWFTLHATAYAANIVQIAVDEHDIPFLLDNEGHVWAFKDPRTFSGGPDEPPAPPNLQWLVKLPNLENIKKIAPYIAIDGEGQVFTWQLDKTELHEGYVTVASFKAPRRFRDLKGITKVAYTAGRFAAVINNKDVISWSQANPSGEIQKIFSHEGIKNISIANSVAKAGQPSSSFAVEVLLNDGTLMGFGVTPTGQVEIPQTYQIVSLGKFPGAIGLSINIAHSVVVSATGVPNYLGECDVVKKDTNGHIEASVGVHVVNGSLTDIIQIGTAINQNDDYVPNVYIKRDGTVWFEFAPSPSNLHGFSKCSLFNPTMYYRHAEQISAGNATAIQVALGNEYYFMLDANHNLWSLSIWERRDKRNFRTIPVSLN